ncbi:hypothetical protein ASE12_00270 [Aeromicrobium sp. Root236]|nr:hypothetical protein [Aeromicrobium sp. Root236]KRC63327.1 hypothetical protein ASE12_00270 [Aeromicrobium sp. Root236]
MSHRLGLYVAHLSDGQPEAFGHDPPGHRHGQRIAHSEPQAKDLGQLVGHAVEQVEIAGFALRCRSVLVAEGLLGTVLHGHRGADPVPGVRREPSPTVRIEPVDRADQTDGT